MNSLSAFLQEVTEILLEGYRQRGNMEMVELLESVNHDEAIEIVDYIMAVLELKDCKLKGVSK